MRREETELVQEKKRPKLKGRKFNGKNPWWNSDGDDTPYEPGDDVKKTRKEAVDYVAELWRNRQLQEDETVDEAMRPGPRQRKLADKQYQTYGVTTRDRANAHNIAVRGDGPGTPGYEKKSTGGKGSRYAGYGDQGAGNKARRRSGLEPLRGTRDPRNEEYELNEMPYQIYGPAKHGPSDGEPVKIGKPYKNKKRAKSRADRLDQEIGGYRHSVHYTPEEFAAEAKNKEGKEQGLDGKACWKGYKKAGTKMKGGRVVDNCVKMEDVAEIATAYFMNEGLNEYGIDLLIEDMGLDDFCDFIDEISSEEFLVEWRRGAGGTKVRGSGMSKSGKSIGSLKGGAKASAIRGSAEHKARKAARDAESSKSSGMTSALKSQSKIAMAKKSQPETKSTPTQTKEKAKGGILGALKARAEKDIASVKQSVNTARQVGARRAAEVKATYDAVRAKGKEAEQSAAATRARRKATVAAGRAAQSAGRTAVKAAGAAGSAAGEAVKAKKAGKSAAATAGRAVGTFVKKMRKEEKELLTRYFIESEIAFNYNEVQEIFESLDQEHFDYFLEQANLIIEESGPSAREVIEEKLQNNFNIERFTFADWRHLTEKKTSDDTATSKFVSLTQTNRTDNTPDVKGKRKDGVIINPSIDMRSEEVEEIDEKAPPGAKYERMVKHIKDKYKKGGLTKQERGIAYATAWKKYNEEVEVIDERRREDKGTPRPPEPSAAFKLVSKSMGAGRAGVQPRGQKKVPGKKPPAAGEYGGPKSPAQKVAMRRAAAQRAKDMMSSRFD